jgi:hypothetical protein
MTGCCDIPPGRDRALRWTLAPFSNQMRAMITRALPACLMLLLAACGGGGPAASPSPTPSPTPAATPPTTSQCSLRERQLWAERQIREWYLFPDDLPSSINPAQFNSLDAFIDALTATARAAGRDRFFTFATSIAAEDAFIRRGQTASFGIRLRNVPGRGDVLVVDSIETGPAFAAGIDRGAEITGIGNTPETLRGVAGLFTLGGAAAVANAFGPDTPGTTRTIEFRSRGVFRTVTITKTVFNIPPVSSRFGVQTLPDGAGGRVGYINLRSFIDTARAPLREAFQGFRTAGIDRVIIDYRYNGGGLVDVAELTGDLLGRNRLPSDVFSFTRFRPSKSAENETRLFRSAAESIAPSALAFITLEDTASASELVINAMLPYLGGNLAMVGENTAGKPVGQIAIDNPACDDRLRIVAFASDNANRQGNYFNGMAPLVTAGGGRTCAAGDDVTQLMGNSNENATAGALAALRGDACTAIGTVPRTAVAPGSLVGSGRVRDAPLLRASAPSPAQREMPGLF